MTADDNRNAYILLACAASIFVAIFTTEVSELDPCGSTDLLAAP
jgi:hypothetical protein